MFLQRWVRKSLRSILQHGQFSYISCKFTCFREDKFLQVINVASTKGNTTLGAHKTISPLVMNASVPWKGLSKLLLLPPVVVNLTELGHRFQIYPTTLLKRALILSHEIQTQPCLPHFLLVTKPGTTYGISPSMTAIVSRAISNIPWDARMLLYFF